MPFFYSNVYIKFMLNQTFFYLLMCKCVNKKNKWKKKENVDLLSYLNVGCFVYFSKKEEGIFLFKIKIIK